MVTVPEVEGVAPKAVANNWAEQVAELSVMEATLETISDVFSSQLQLSNMLCI